MKSLVSLAILPLAAQAVRIVQSNDDGWAESYIRTFNDALNKADDQADRQAAEDADNGRRRGVPVVHNVNDGEGSRSGRHGPDRKIDPAEQDRKNRTADHDPVNGNGQQHAFHIGARQEHSLLKEGQHQHYRDEDP